MEAPLTGDITAQILIHQASDDVQVDNDAQNAFCKLVPNCSIELANTKHSLFWEEDSRTRSTY